jgi:6-phosphogluconolactonase
MMSFAAGTALAGTGATLHDSPGTFLLYAGTYTLHGSKGIYAFRFRACDGKIQPLGLAAEAVNPSALALVPAGSGGGAHRLLATQETSKTSNGMDGAVLSYTIDPSSGSLQLIDKASSHGDGPCSLALDERGRYVFVANFWGGSAAVLPLLPDGRFGKASAIVRSKGHSTHPERQTGPHPHAFCTMPGDRFAILADLGIDRLLIYRFDADSGHITPAAPPFFQIEAGSGPRHLAFSDDGRILYVINEISCTISVLSVDRTTGGLTLLQTIATMDPGLKQPGDAAEICLHPNGRFLYASTRQTSTIRLFQVDGRSGVLTPVRDFSTAGQSPATFALDPSGRWLIAANQISNNLALFPIDPLTGILGKLHSNTPVQTPSSLVFSPCQSETNCT